MKKLLFGSAVLMVAAVGAYASAQTATTNAFYKVNVGTPLENCIAFQTPKDCVVGQPTCVDFIPALGSVQQLYDQAVPIPGTDRFECQDELREIL